MSAEEIVNEFMAAVGKKDFDRACALVTDDLVYDNVPIPTVHGPQAMRDFLAPMDAIDIIVHRQIAVGDVVFNERTDRITIGDISIDLPVAGIFEIRDGKIALWRDYFDMQTLTSKMTPPA